MFALLALFLSIDLFIIMVWEIVDPMHAEKNFTGRKVRKVEDRCIFLELFLKSYLVEFLSTFPNLEFRIL